MTRRRKNKPTTPQPKRKRGGQPGNTNALKNGLYSTVLQQTCLDQINLLLSHSPKGINRLAARVAAVDAAVAVVSSQYPSSKVSERTLHLLLLRTAHSRIFAQLPPRTEVPPIVPPAAEDQSPESCSKPAFVSKKIFEQ